jgi:CAAX prenyl protease-like protein
MDGSTPGRLWPYLAPYAVLVGLAELGGWLPALAAPLLAARVLLPALLVLAAWRLGAYPELAAPQRRAGVPDIAVGLAVAALWLAPYLLWPALPRGAPFDPDALGPELRPAWLALRVVGFAAVSPLVEELFVRSFLHRAAEAWPAWRRFAGLPVGRAHRAAFAVTVVWFTLTHSPWEWWVALPTGVIFNLWLYRRGSLASVWLAHAVANAAIGVLVTLGPFELWAFL